MFRKILILGGTGAMGTPLVQVLLNKQYTVAVTSRSSHTTECKGLKYLLGDAHNKEFLESVLEEYFDAIVDFMQYDNMEEFRELLPIKLKRAKQYIFCSSGRVYAEMEEVLTEESELLSGVKDPMETYAMNKIEQEKELQKFSEYNWTIIRPYITYNTERLQLGKFEKEDWLYRAMHKRSIVLPRVIMDKVTTMTYGCDVAVAIEQLIGNERAFRDIIQITTNEFISWKNVSDVYLQVLEEKINYRPQILLYDDELMKPSLDRRNNRKFDNLKLINISDASFCQVKEGLKKCLSAYIDEQREFKNIAWTTQARMDLFALETTALKEISTFEERFAYMKLRFGGYKFIGVENELNREWQEWVEDIAQKDYACMKTVFETNFRIGIYAVSNFARRIIGGYLLAGNGEKGVDITLYDSNPILWGKYVDDYIVEAPQKEVLSLLDVLIIASDRYYDEIYNEYSYLEQLGIKIISAKEILSEWRE